MPAARGGGANVAGPAVGSRFPRSYRFVRLRRRSAAHPCVQRELHAGVRSAGDVSSEEVCPAASGRLEYAIDERALRRRHYAPLRKKAAFRAARERQSSISSRRVPARGSRARARSAVKSTAHTRRRRRRDSATPVSEVPRQKQRRKGRRRGRERERGSGSANRSVQPNLYRPAVISRGSA